MKPTLLSSAVLAWALAAGAANAAVSEQQAAELGKSLTPVGAEKAGNASGTIPEWTGGLAKDAAPVQNGFMTNPYADDKPEFVITAANYEQYAEQLTPGQIAMFKRYPDSYKMPVYPTRRSIVLPDEVNEATRENAVNTRLVQGGNGLENYKLANAFPIPQDGLEVIWNQITRYRGHSMERVLTQATPQTNGNFTIVRFNEQYVVPQALTDYDAARMGNILYYFKQQVTDPGRLAGNVLLVHETINQVETPRMAWIYNAGQRRVRRAPQVSYDGPGTAADGLRTSDNLDMYNGAPDRYDWELVGKKEIFIPYNSYELESPKYKYADVIKAGHINQDLTRYELHRVWELKAKVKADQRHIYAQRHVFIDEDSWQAAHIDHYDARGELWRVAEAHTLHRYDAQVPGYALETLYDLVAGRYLAMGMYNEESRGYNYDYKANSNEFTPAALRQSGVR
ncbi:DUF1329 domain-containing protein [Halopseudomonas nanhaiensis]|uniref:DUF1329 domain-containing protein n=1 Tax=Halopseudomonas nanhaiensis TaxID=2830842 RepID=UPI001CC06A8A|nr:DUF1329 domain-containing protein [Halopseudomonas nanhaiensis]UAW98935.1 DUF1329 domain-containing protein [Halopseudomonas nanhaiensis]